MGRLSSPTVPLVISQKDLRDLVTSPDGIRRAIDKLQHGLRLAHAGANGTTVFGDVALEGNNFVKILGCAGPGQPMSVQCFASQGNAASDVNARIMMLFDGTSGALEALIAADDLNALRTAVPAGLGARHLAPEGARVLGILGAGYQAENHALTLTAAVPGLESVVVWSPTPASRERFAAEQTERLGLEVVACDTAEEVVRRADVLTAAGRTRGHQPAYEASWVRPGSLLISMTGSAPRELFGQARFVVPTRRRPQLVAFGFVGSAAPDPLPDPEGTVELAEIMAGLEPVRTHPGQNVIWELAQVYLWDPPMAAWAYEWAVEHGRGTPVELTAICQANEGRGRSVSR